MRRKTFKLFVFSFITICVFLLAGACGKGPEKVPEKVPEEQTDPIIYGPLTIKVEETLNLYEGGEYSLKPTLEDETQVIDNPIFTFESDNESVTVSESGRIKGIFLGSARIKITGEPQGRPEDRTVAIVTVKVVTKTRLSLSENSVTIYSMPTLCGKNFENKIVLTGEIIGEDGETVAAEDLVWSSENEDVCKIRENEIIGVSVGDTKVWAETTFGSEKLRSFVYVNVDYPIIEVEDVLLINKEDPIVTVDFSEGGINKVLNVADVTSGTWLKVNDGALDGKTIISGERKYVVCNDMYGYKFDYTVVADRVLKTTEETYEFLNNATTSNTRDKYFALGENVDFNGLTLIADNGFAGVFNGLGHSIYNVLGDVTGQGGLWNSLFGGLSGEIKNLGLLNVNMCTGCDGVLCDSMSGEARIDNVFIHIKKGGTTDQSGAICRRVDGTNNVISNSVIWWEGISAHIYNGLLFGFGSDGSKVTFENTYVIAENQANRHLVGQRTNEGYQVFRAAMNELDSEHIRSYADFVANGYFDKSKAGKFWDFDSCYIPTVKSAVDAFAIDTFINVYKNPGEVENIFSCFKASMASGYINSTKEIENGSEYIAGGIYLIPVEKVATVNSLYIGNSEIAKSDYKYNRETGEIELTVGAVYNIGGKDLPFVLKTDAGNKIYKINVYDDVITTAERLSDILNKAQYDETVFKCHSLGEDIDYSGKAMATRGQTYAGDFDGLGHTIYNVSSNEEFTGLFGTLQGGIYNLAIVNATISGSGGLLADCINDGSVIDNVFIHVLSDTGTGNHGAIGRFVLGRCKITDVVIWFETRATESQYAGALFGFGNASANADISGTYVIIDEECRTRHLVGQRNDAAYANFKSQMNALDSSVVKTLAEFTETDKSGIYNDYWNKTDYNVYIISSAAQRISADTLYKIAKTEDIGIVGTVIKDSDDESLISNEAVIDVSQITGTISEVNINGEQVAYSVSGNKISILSEVFTEMNGLADIRIIIGGVVYGGKIEIVEYCFTTALKLNEFLCNAATEDTAGKIYTLGADIDYSGKAMADRGQTFSGSFDGKGHIVYNLACGAVQFTALFGNLNGTIKNLGIVNADVSGYGGLLVDMLSGGTIDNVFIHISSDTAAGHHGAIARFPTGQFSVSNTVVWYENRAVNSNGGLLFGFGLNGACGSTLENVYAIVDASSANRNMTSQRGDASYANFKSAMNAYASLTIKTVSEFSGSGYTFESDYWDNTSYKIAVFKRAITYLSATTKEKISL